MDSGTLYLVATPIGNLEDITFRALRILKDVDLIAAEDTRQTLKLLNHFEISKPLISYYRHNEEIRNEELLKKLRNGSNIAIVTDAGTPGISDPGEKIVKVAIEKEINVVPIPGACAMINALIASGLDTNEFCFYGFLPINKKFRKEKFEEVGNEGKTVIIYEAPHRLIGTLKEIEEKLGNRQIVVAKELTKIHESFYRGTVSDVLKMIKEPKGEYIVLIKGEKTEKKNDLSFLTLEQHYEFYEKQGYSKKEIIKKIAKDRNVSKNEIYQKFI
ncbi:MAG: 16S rRNA (cytidine(1402)-2'-O)-methyltransferase [Clostridia bacterium]|nr:16S rRNA (cytidine(1402)-2'-O)-methyltransferase [Clostridia bacterium]